MNRVEMNRKQMLEYIARTLGMTGGVIAEVGVLRGTFAKSLQDALAPSRMYLVDPWQAFPPSEFSDYTSYSQAKWDAIAASVASRFPPPVNVILRMTSEEAAQHVPDGSLDMVYLDGNHAYEHVAQDLRLWFQKVRPGGFIAGHDIDRKSVGRAVGEFLTSISASAHMTNEKSCCSYFWQR
jgi:hypothetical protein